jgi:hypothetical protein
MELGYELVDSLCLLLEIGCLMFLNLKPIQPDLETQNFIMNLNFHFD